MITKDLQAVEIEGQLGGTAIDVTIHEDAMGHVMYQLANLYEDSILAFIRESATNAFDATIETFPEGSPRRAAALRGIDVKPIEVTLPTRLAPMFIVRDYGTGMDFDTIKMIYSKFGASTKRESNDYNGALGFGCKAPLAYATQFSVTSVKNGKRISLSISRKPNGGITMQVVEGDPGNEVPTTEPQGTTLMVPISASDVNEVGSTARSFFRYWKPGTVLIDGEEPETVSPAMRLSDTLSILDDDEADDHVLMANVAYPIPFGFVVTGLKDGYSLLAEVPTGAVEFTPSREGLKTHQANRDALKKVQAEFQRAVAGAIQRKIDEATSKPAALAAMIYWRDCLPPEARSSDDMYSWRGAQLPSKWEDPRLPGGAWPFITSAVRSSPASRHDKRDKISANRFARDFFVTGWTSTQLSTPQKRRLNMWREDKTPPLDHFAQREVQFVLCRSESIPADVRQWIDPKRIVSWKHIKDTYKLPSQGNSTAWGSWKQVRGSYEDVWTELGATVGETPASKIRQDKPIYYFQTREQNLAQATILPRQLHREFTVVQLQANRVGKFCRDFPKARHLRTALDECYRKWQATITQDHLDALAIKNAYRYGRVPFESLNAAKVDDPAIKRAIHLAKMDLTEIQNRDRVFSNVLRKSLTVPAFKDPMDRYPLATGRSGSDSRTMAHIYMYLNAAYAADLATQATTTP